MAVLCKCRSLLDGPNGDGMPRGFVKSWWWLEFVFFGHSSLMLAAVSGCQPFFLLHCGGGFVERGY